MSERGDLSWLQDVLAATAEELVRRRSGTTPDGSEAEQTLHRLTGAAAQHVPGASYAGLTVRTPEGGLSSRAPSDRAIVDLDRAQAELGEGPCVDALGAGSGSVTVVDDFAAEDRWPRFARLAQEAGIGALISFALAPQDAEPGALNLYARTGTAFDATARTVAAAFATQASVAMYGARRVEQLTHAITTRDVIGQAKGILMERFSLDEHQAFDLLVRSSQDTNIKLLDVSRWLTDEVARRAGRHEEVGGEARPPTASDSFAG
ncbi:GAF and ANTAR domain-containing protein [Actinomycetospora soli]|uniref:GAF and ANTAR domain-containing protein n=1 Tax=Actinomycetospora soli TaxID=2893887 RepID=UPI001E371ED1|nr:GAF and ANTAR domain-containing protein [Actinomycetospora soli]MCD2190560.1 GAF and ANTAR domain-containing protein [Actinomycetospora soli]